MKNLMYILGSLFILIGFEIKANDFDLAKKSFSIGAEAYKNGDYEKALGYFLQADSAADGFDINYNLGNTYFKLGEIPETILYYERALKYAPTNEDVRHNLKIANGQIVDRIETIPQSKLKLWWEDFKYSIGPDGWAWISIGWALLAGVMGLLYFLSQGKNRRRIGFFGGLLSIALLIVSFLLASQADEFLNTANAAVVFTDKVDVRSEPRTESTQVFVLHAGTRVKLLSQDGVWYNVEIASGNKGWIQVADLEEI